MLKVLLRRRLTRFSQMAEPFVCFHQYGSRPIPSPSGTRWWWEWMRNGKGTYVVVHVGCPEQPHGNVVGELHVVDVRTVLPDVSPIVDVIVFVDEADACDPVPESPSQRAFLCVW